MTEKLLEKSVYEKLCGVVDPDDASVDARELCRAFSIRKLAGEFNVIAPGIRPLKYRHHRIDLSYRRQGSIGFRDSYV